MKYEIVDGLPLKKRPYKKWNFPFDKLEVGQVIVVTLDTNEEFQRAREAARGTAARHSKGAKQFKIRVMRDHGPRTFGIWREE